MLRDFFHWWLTQLKALLPDSIKSRLRQEFCLLYLDVDQDQVNIHAHYRGAALRFGDLPLGDIAEDHPEFQSWLAGLPRRPDRILLRLTKGRFLSRNVELPLAAEENLGEAIGFQLEQLTPFSADQVICFNGINERLPAEKKLRAWLVVTPTEQVEQALALLEGPPPTPERMPNHAPVQNEKLQLVFRPFGKADGGSFRGTLLLAALLLICLGSVFALHIQNRVETRNALLQALTGIRTEAAEASRLREEVAHMQQQADHLSARHQQQAQFLPLWNDLSERLEEDTWLQRINLRDQELSLQGISENASRLIEQLEKSPFLEKVSFSASVTRDRKTGHDRFNINAQVVRPKEEPEAQPPKEGGA